MIRCTAGATGTILVSGVLQELDDRQASWEGYIYHSYPLCDATKVRVSQKQSVVVVSLSHSGLVVWGRGPLALVWGSTSGVQLYGSIRV